MVHVGSSRRAEGSSSSHGEAQRVPDRRWARGYTHHMMALHSASTAADSLSQPRRTVDTRWTRTYARQLPLALLVHRRCDGDIIGIGSEEFRRIGVAGWIDEQQIPEHGGNRLARDRDHALAGTGHG
jgi:hypothetical protein